MFELFAVTNRGLETTSAEEMAQLRGLQVKTIGYRHILANYTGKAAHLLSLRTVDDLFIYLTEWQEIGPHRVTLARLEQLALDLDLWDAVNVRAEIHPLGENVTFSISANFVGRRNYTTDEIKLAIAKSIETITGWHYTEDDRQGDINIRIFIEHENALIGMRLANAPLHKRTYKQEHVLGSLKPSVAAAMLFLAQVQPSQTLLDPCCGAGTILIEAANNGLHAIGGDHDDNALAAATRNAQAANVTIELHHWDTRALPTPEASIDRIVSNLPWGRQVEVDDNLAAFYQAACQEIERVITPNGRIVLLTNRPELVIFDSYQVEKQIEISLFGQTPTIVALTPAS